uniref:Protein DETOXIFICATION n=1 Tax=Salix viminalis TaxID=40686 RepID=A0A6N2NIL7_SALVM
MKVNDFRNLSYRIMGNSMEERLVSPEELDSGSLKKRVWKESKKLWKIAFPGMVARVCSFGMIVVTQLFMGHISELDLAAYGLQQSILLRFVDGILIGMSSATETLCGQAYGAGHYHMMGVYLQRS